MNFFNNSESNQKIYTEMKKPIVNLKKQYKLKLDELYYLHTINRYTEQEYKELVSQLDEAYLLAKTRLKGINITIEVEK